MAYGLYRPHKNFIFLLRPLAHLARGRFFLPSVYMSPNCR